MATTVANGEKKGERGGWRRRLRLLIQFLKQARMLGLGNILAAGCGSCTAHTRNVTLADALAQQVDAGKAPEAARLLASMAQLGLQRPCAGVSAAMVEDCKRPDAAATLFIQLVENQAAGSAAEVVAEMVQRGRMPAAKEAAAAMIAQGQATAVALVGLELVKMGKRDVAADLFIALMKAESPEQVHAVSTVVAVMLAKGYADETAQAVVRLIDKGQPRKVALLKAELLDHGCGLSLTCDLAAAAVRARREDAPAVSHLALFEMGRADVAAHILRELGHMGRDDAVWRCMAASAHLGRYDAYAGIYLDLARLGAADTIAKFEAALVRGGELDAAREGRSALARSGAAWAAAASLVQLVRSGEREIAAIIDGAVVKVGRPGDVVELATIAARSGHVSEAAAAAEEAAATGNHALLAAYAAGLVQAGFAGLAANLVMGAGQADMVATIAVQLSDVGRSHVGARLAIAIMRAGQLDVLRDALLSLGSEGRADVAAVMLLDLRDMEMGAALAQIVNAAMVRERAGDAAHIAEALAARANLPDLLDALRAAGAHIEPAVWHTATAVIRTDCLPRGVAVAPQERAEDPAFEAKWAAVTGPKVSSGGSPSLPATPEQAEEAARKDVALATSASDVTPPSDPAAAGKIATSTKAAAAGNAAAANAEGEEIFFTPVTLGVEQVALAVTGGLEAVEEADAQVIIMEPAMQQKAAPVRARSPNGSDAGGMQRLYTVHSI